MKNHSYTFGKQVFWLLMLALLSTTPLAAQKSKINYSDKNMRWIISRLNTELTFEEFSKRFKGAAIGSQDDLKSAIPAVKGIEGEIYVFSSKYITYRVFVDKNKNTIYAKAGRRRGSKENKKALLDLYNLPIYSYDGGDTYLLTRQLRDANDPMVHLLFNLKGYDYLYWGDPVNQLLVRLNIFSYEFDGIEVMVNGWYEFGDIEQWKGKFNGEKQPMDYNQLLNIEELQRPAARIALAEQFKAAWTPGRISDLYDLDFSKKKGLCIKGCDQPNGNQQIFYGNIYYDGPVKNGLPHGEADHLSLIKNVDLVYNQIVADSPFNVEGVSMEHLKKVFFREGKAEGKVNFSLEGLSMSMIYERGIPNYLDDLKSKKKFWVNGWDYDFKYIKGPLKDGKFSESMEVHIENTKDSTFLIYKGELIGDLQAHGKGTYYRSKSDRRNQFKELKGSLEGTWIRGSLSRKYLINVKGKQYQSSGIGFSSVSTSTGLAVGDKVTVINNKIPMYRTTGKMIDDDPKCPEGIWTLEKLNISTNEYEPYPFTDKYVFEKGYCMFKASYDANGKKVEDINVMGMSEYVTPEARDVMIAQAKREREEKERLEAIAQAKKEKEEAEARERRAEEARKREYAQLASFEEILRQYTDSDVKIASKGWLFGFPKAKTTGSAGIFIINTNKSSKTFKGTVTFTHPTKGEDTQDITLRVGGANSNGYGAAKAPYNLGFGRSYEIAFDLDGNTSGVYYFIYYFGILR